MLYLGANRVSLYDFYRTKKWEQFRQALINERTNKNGEVKCEECKKYTLLKNILNKKKSIYGK